jgi:predicted AAA+ superfamily ATPase
MFYRTRVIDEELKTKLRVSGGVLMAGPKACGKTESARQIAKSEIRVDVDPTVELAMQTDPSILLLGETPRLIDEWQEQPQLWNLVRHEIDDRKLKGQFILAGSSKPVEETKMHSGAGRIARLRMRPMSWWESGISSGEVSLKALLAGYAPKSSATSHGLKNLAGYIVTGGWPELIGSSVDDARIWNRDYLTLLSEVDVSRVSNRKRDPVKVRRLLSSYARNTAIPASISTLATDTTGEDSDISRATASDYVDALSRLMIVEDLPAWNAHLRSKAELRTMPKRHLVDPAIAVAALNADVDALMKDLVFLGFLFESVVVRDLRIYGQAMEAEIAHYRDTSRREADIIMQFPDYSWAAFEVKLGLKGADEGAAALLKIARDVDGSKTGNCLGLTVITGFGFAHRRKDGVNVVPLSTLTV